MNNFKSIWTNPLHYIACGFGVGASPIMPGTLGTFVGVLFYLVMMRLSLGMYCFILFILIVSAIFLCDRVNKDFGTDDHPAAVMDEIVGFLVVMIGLPHNVFFISMGFLLFRIFDIGKPGIIGYVDQHWHGGWGVVMDDILAALHASGFLWIIYLLSKSPWLLYNH